MLIAWRAEVHGISPAEERCLKIIPLVPQQRDRREPHDAHEARRPAGRREFRVTVG
mgnify:FL=1